MVMAKLRFCSACLAVAMLIGLLFTWQAIKAQGDITAPVVVDVLIEPQSVDTSSAPQVITFTAVLSDDLSGVNYAELQFYPDVGTTQYLGLFLGESELVSGNNLHGTYVVTRTLPRYAAEGRWEMSLAATADNVGNSTYYTEDTEPQIIYRYFVNEAASTPPPTSEPSPQPTMEPTPLPTSLATPMPTVAPGQLFIPAVSN